jgi:hypothetical protein
MEPLRQVYQGVMLTQIPDSTDQKTSSHLKRHFYAEGMSTSCSPTRKLGPADREKSMQNTKQDLRFTRNKFLSMPGTTSDSWVPRSRIASRKDDDKDAFSLDFTAADEKNNPSDLDFFASIRGWKKSVSNSKSRKASNSQRERMVNFSNASGVKYEVYLRTARSKQQ